MVGGRRGVGLEELYINRILDTSINFFSLHPSRPLVLVLGLFLHTDDSDTRYI